MYPLGFQLLGKQFQFFSSRTDIHQSNGVKSGKMCPPEDICQCLKTFLMVVLERDDCLKPETLLSIVWWHRTAPHNKELSSPKVKKKKTIKNIA
jgi:hypothetical protein